MRKNRRTGRPLRAAALALALSTVTACAVRDAACSLTGREDARTAEDGSPVANGGAAGTGPFTITFLGDSVTAGLGLRSEDAYPALVQRKFAADGYDTVEVVNAGVTGETTAGGVRRLGEILQPNLRVLVVSLGSNDALRGVSPTETGYNLSTIVEAAIEKRVIVVVTGMDPPTNLGDDYQQAFRHAFAQLASDYKDNIAYIPSLLDGVAGNPMLNQTDGVRPNAEGARVIAQNMYAKLQVIVDSLGGGR